MLVYCADANFQEAKYHGWRVRITFGLKAHSGWAVLVGICEGDAGLVVTDRHRMELADLAGGEWARQPYHAAEGLTPARARKVVEDGIAIAQRLAVSEMKAALTRAKIGGHTVAGCAVLTGTPMAAWSVEEILAVHVRMHMAEGALYRDVLIHAARTCKLPCLQVREKQVLDEAVRALRKPGPALVRTVSGLKSQAGAPWGKDQKDASLAAMIAMAGKT